MSEQPWHKRFHSDALSGYLDLTLEERGAYTTLLDMLYDRREPIIENERLLAGYLGVSVRKMRSVIDALIAKGKIHRTDDGRLSNRRFEKEIENELKTARKRAENGSNGGRTRAENAKNINENNETDQAGLEPDLSLYQKPYSRSQEEAPLTPLSGGEDEFAQAVWEVFPRHLNSTKSDAEAEWSKLSVAERRDCRLGAQAYRDEHDKAAAQGRNPIPKKLSTWIAKRGWEGMTPAAAGDVAVIAPTSPDFPIIKAYLGERLVLSKSGNATVLVSDLVQARAAA